jgi:hypothetical protein
MALHRHNNYTTITWSPESCFEHTGHNGGEVSIMVKGHEERQRTSTYKTIMNE